MSVQDQKLETVVTIQVNKRKKVKKDATVIEAFNHRYIKVDMEDNHTFCLKWNGLMYEGTFLDMPMTCQYKVERDFSIIKTTHNSGLKPTVVRRSKSGRPASMTN